MKHKDWTQKECFERITGLICEKSPYTTRAKYELLRFMFEKKFLKD